MNHDTIPRLLQRLDYLWDKLLCNCCREEKDGKIGTNEEKLWWCPDTNCPDCKPISRWLRYLDEHPEDFFY